MLHSDEVVTYQLLITPSAHRQLRKLPEQAQRQIEAKLLLLCADPFAPGLDVKKLQGEEHLRLRVGRYRVIYEMLNAVLTVKVIAVGHRKNVYH